MSEPQWGLLLLAELGKTCCSYPAGLFSGCQRIWQGSSVKSDGEFEDDSIQEDARRCTAFVPYGAIRNTQESPGQLKASRYLKVRKLE